MLAVLKKVWKTLDYICGKRLVPVLGEVVGRLEHFGEIICDAGTREKLGRISAATRHAAVGCGEEEISAKGTERDAARQLAQEADPDADIFGMG